jgi:hypothetical protein
MPNREQLPIRLVCATRLSQEQFFAKTFTGQSVHRAMQISNVEVQVYCNNTAGLSKLYNDAIDLAANRPATLVFLHDDILILDFHYAERIRAGLERFDIVGLAGNKRRVPRQPSWAFINDAYAWDDKSNLRGGVGSDARFFFGQTDQPCVLLDGVLLAAKSTSLIDRNLRFDPAFDFHFYDLDFCRQAELAGLTMGTISLAVEHSSSGNFQSQSWKEAYSTYLGKWRE